MHPLVKRLLSLSEEDFHHGLARPREELDELERELGVPCPDDYRAVLLELGSCAIAGPRMRLNVDLTEDAILSLTDDVLNERMPGIVLIGNDGGDYGYYYDPAGRLGHGAFALYFVEMGTLTFEDSHFVAPTLTEAIERVLGGENFRELPRLGPSPTT